MAAKNLSGLDWYKKNQSKYPDSNSLADLSGSFKTNVTNFIKALQDAGAKVSIDSTLRDPTRAFLMHWAWKVAKGMVKADKVPSKSGVDIEWDHGDDKESQKAAQDMIGKSGFNMAYIAALDSNHLTGNAIDMDISWSGPLKVKNAKGEDVQIATSPTNGNNKELHAVGDTYGVKKLASDPPHWSYNGR
jgi:hypothetical protein